jgi:hypothetical protein
MSASKSLPARPSFESLRKQAKKLARDRSLSLRDAQLVLAREYGFAGWQDLTAEVSKRLGKGLQWAVAQAERAIHDNDIERLKQLLAEYPALLLWEGGEDNGGLLNMATSAYGDAGDAQREQWFTRGACAELLIEAGAVVTPRVCEGILESRARGLLQLFHRKRLLPHTLEFFAAVGDLDAVRSALDENTNDLDSVNEAFVTACRFDRQATASLLLERSISLDQELGRHLDASTDRQSFIRAFSKSGEWQWLHTDVAQVAALGLWKMFVMAQVQRALHEGDLTAFVGRLQREPWLLGDDYVSFQERLIDTASFTHGRGEFIAALLDLNPAIVRRQPPPRSRAIEWAVMYANTHLLPMLTRIWPLPDDLPHAAGTGNLARVKQWFDNVGTIPEQQVLDVALAFAVINRHFEVADFLLAHGADINTKWNSHEPASILHHLVFLPTPYESMQFLIDRGIDMTIKDYRWDATAQGWARYGNNDEKMAQWLEEAERQQKKGGSPTSHNLLTRR